MSESLPPVIERELRRWARELRVGDGGLLMLAVGCSAKRRLAVEARLGSLLEGWEVAPVVIEGDCGDPWGPIPTSTKQTLVSLAGVFDCKDPDGVLAALNLGREHLKRGGPSLLLWVGAIENLERLSLKAPDLWSYRRRVGLFLSAEDFDGGTVHVDEREDASRRIAELRARLDALGADDPRRVDLLFSLDFFLDARGDHDEQARALSESAALLSRAPTDRARMHLIEKRARVASMQYRDDESLEWAWQLDWSEAANATNMAASVYEHRARFQEAERSWQLSRQHHGTVAILRVNEARLWLTLDVLDRAERCCAEAEERLTESRRAYAMYFIVTLRAEVASRRLDTYTALTLLRRSWALARRSNTLSFIEFLVHEIFRHFRAMGLLDDAEQLCMDALVDTTSSTEATALRHQLVEIQSCRDLTRAQNTRERSLANIDTQLATCSGWQRALLRRDRVKLLRLELGPPIDRETCLEELDRLIYDALDQRQYDLAQHARLQQIELHRELEGFARATSITNIALRWSIEHEGPSRHAECHLEFAKTDRAANDLDAAAKSIDTAEQTLSAEDPLYQPRETWKKILIERHRLALAHKDPPAALAALERGLTIAREAGVRAIELELLHHVAELPEHPKTDAARERAALDALELARDALLVFEEARALANLALIEHPRAPKKARRLLEEARFLAPLCPLEPADARMRAAEQHLAQFSPPA